MAWYLGIFWVSLGLVACTGGEEKEVSEPLTLTSSDETGFAEGDPQAAMDAYAAADREVDSPVGQSELDEQAADAASIAAEATNETLERDEQNHLEEPSLGDTAEFWVSSPVLNVRAGPGPKHATIRKLKKGDQVRVLESAGRWMRISESEWVSAEHLSKSHR